MRNPFPFSLRLAGWLISAVIIVYILYILQDMLVPLIFSALFAVMLFPASKRLEKWGFPRILSISISLISEVDTESYLLDRQISEIYIRNFSSK